MEIRDAMGERGFNVSHEAVRPLIACGGAPRVQPDDGARVNAERRG
jgi:hypothetical protein